MPELPEVETIARILRKKIIGKTIKNLIFLDQKLLNLDQNAQLKNKIAGQFIKEIKRRGKFILFNLNGDFKIITHFRMTGTYLYLEQDSQIDTYVRVKVIFEDDSVLLFKDIRRFGQVKISAPKSEISDFKNLGYEPLEESFDFQYLKKIAANSSIPVKLLLLDQSRIAGIGNIYASEILFSAGISPLRPARSLNDNDLKKLLGAIKEVLEKAVKCLGTTFSDYRTPEGDSGGFQECLNVYGRWKKPCLKCSTAIERVILGQRSAFYCPNCQK